MAKAVRPLKYVAESGGYTVLAGGTFIGRVKRMRSAPYHHSNGRTYRAWVWATYPPFPHRGSHHHGTRAAAADRLLALANQGDGE